MIRTLIVDDESIARVVLRDELEAFKDVEIVGEAENAAKLADATAPATLPPTRKVVGRRGDEYFLLDVKDILAFQAEGELVWIITSTSRFLATQSLRKIETHLKDPPFQRVHRNAIVNVNHVRKMSAMSSQRWMLTLSNSQQLVVSKRQARTLQHMLRW